MREVADGAANSAKPGSQEFAWLKQSDLSRVAVYHCDDHKHVVRNPRDLAVSGTGLVVLGLLLSIVGLLPALAPLLGGAGLTGWAIVAWSRAARAGRASRPVLPLFPQVASVEVVERLNGQVSLTEGKYTSTAQEDVRGEITVKMSANDGREWLRKYRRKYRVEERDPVRFAAGFAMFKGRAGLNFVDEPEAVLENGTGLWFRGDSAAGHPLFETVQGQPPGDWKPVVRYLVLKERIPRGIPLWIVPSVFPSSDRRTLEIDLHWNKLGKEGAKLSLTGWKLIELDVPRVWGFAESSDPGGPIITNGDNGRRIIRWEQLPPGGSVGDRRPLDESKSRTLILRFEKPILPKPPEDDPVRAGRPTPTEEAERKRNLLIEGTLKATFGGTLSGIEDVEIFLPGGAAVVPLIAEERPVKSGEPKVRTEVTVRFSISLEGIRYQDDWAIPGDSNARKQRIEAELADGDDVEEIKFRNKTDEFDVVPDYRTVTELTDLISRESYYVKSVVEHLPYQDDGRTNVINHVWDIAGRWYEGVYPIDFDVNLRGEDLGEDGSGPFTGKTVAQVTVKGTYVNEERLTQRKKIEQHWDKLHGHVIDLLKERAGTAAEWSESFGQGTKDIEADLRRQRKRLIDALLAERISEDACREFVARIDEELRDLGRQS